MPENKFVLPGAATHYPPDLDLEPVHLDLDLRVDIPSQTLHGVVTHTLRSNMDGAQEVELHAVDFTELSCSSTSSHRFTYDEKLLRLYFEKPFSRGEERSVSVHYKVVRPAAGLYFSTDHSSVDPALFAATDNETERARHWLPTIDLPSVRPTLSFRIRANESLTIVANGAFQKEELHEDGTKTSHWKLDQRCPSYLTCFAVGDFVRWDGDPFVQTGTEVPIACFTTKRHEPADLERSFEKTKEMLEWMTKRLGNAYPYPKYFQFAAPGIGGAMENISLVSWDERFVIDEDLIAEERQLIDVINLHEMAHTWFGDHVVCRDYAHAWLKESWATYMESVWLHDALGEDAHQHDLWVSQTKYMEESDGKYARPIVTRTYSSSFDMYDYHLYPGGAWRIHMLRHMLGDDVFWPAVSTYLAEFGEETVETVDFQRVLEKASGRSLGKFFDRWIHTAGYPKIKGKFSWDPKDKVGRFSLNQSCSTGSKGELYEFELPLAYEQDGVTMVHATKFIGKSLEVALPMECEPEWVAIDPHGMVLHALEFEPGDPRWRALLKAGGARSRIQAAHALAKSQKPSNMNALEQAFVSEAFWGVRDEMAQALAAAQSESALQVLLKIGSKHQEPQSLPALMRALSSYRDPRVSKLLLSRIEEGMAPRAMEAALIGLGKQRSDANQQSPHFSVLVNASKGESRSGFAEIGAYQGLAESHDQRSIAVLVDAVTEPKRSYLRYWGARALGTAAARLRIDDPQRRVAKETLVDALRDEQRAVRRGAILGLVSLGDTSTIPSIAKYASTLSTQEYVRARHHIRGMRARNRNKKEFLSAMDELREKVRSLESKCEKLERKSSREAKSNRSGTSFDS